MSILSCQQKQFAVINSPEFCTKTIQVEERNKTYYLEHGLRLLLESSQPVECELEGDIFEAQDQHGRKVHLTQEDQIQVYKFISGKLNDTDLISLGLTIQSAFSYSSFDKSGLYDPSFLEMRRDYLFRGDLYHDMTRKVTMSFFHDTKTWKNKKNQNLNFMDYISSTSLLDTVLGSIYMRFIKEFLGYVSYFSSIGFLIQVVNYARKLYKKHSRVGQMVNDIEASSQPKFRLSTISKNLEDQEITYRNPRTYTLKYD